MFKELRWPALLLTMLVLLTPGSALAKRHREYRRHAQLGVYAKHGPSYPIGRSAEAGTVTKGFWTRTGKV